MKGLLRYLLVVVTVSAVTGCELFNAIIEPSHISLADESDARLVFSEHEDSYSVAFKTNSSWFAVSDSYWCEIEPAEGDKSMTEIIVKVSRNSGTDDRVAVVTLSTEDKNESVVIQVSQDKMPVLSADVEYYEIPQEGGQIAVRFQYNVSYDVSISEDASWISEMTAKSVSSAIHEFFVEPNLEEKTRSAIIKFTDSSKGNTETIEVFQFGVPPRQDLVLKVTHVNDVFAVPEFNDGLSGMIYWDYEGDSSDFGSFEEYWYNSLTGEKTVTFELRGYQEEFYVEFSDIKGLVEIDLSGL